jgi:transposase
LHSVILVGRVSGVRADLVPDDLWERVAPLLPPAPERRRHHPGRLRVPDRTTLAGVLCVLRTGVAWRDVPAETVGCSGVTAWRRLRDWTEAGARPRLHAALLSELCRADLLALDDCAVDGSHIRALKGGITLAPHMSTGPAPASSTTWSSTGMEPRSPSR